jgi:hypothetical protein
MATDGMEERLRELERYRVSIALRDGSRLVDCLLVSADRPGTRTLGIFDGTGDVFVPVSEVIDVWEHPPGPAAAA